MVSRVTYANGDTLHYGYDKAGNLVRETDADGGITRYDYDLLGQLTNVLSADGTTTEYRYNADGEVVSEFIRSIAFSRESDGENHYSNLVHTSSKPLVATAIRYPEDAFDSTKGRSATKAPSQKPTPPQPKKPTPAKPKTPAQEYAKARRQATTPTMDEYQQLLRIGYTGGFGQYANDKQRSNFPSPAEYMYNKQQGRPNYQTYGPVEVANYQSGETYYRIPHISALTTPKVGSGNSLQKYYCGDASTYNRQAAVIYAREWAGEYHKSSIADFFFNSMTRNPDYYNYTTNCANFVSQCLVAGGIEMTDNWHQYKETDFKNPLRIMLSLFPFFGRNLRYDWDTGSVTKKDEDDKLIFVQPWSEAAAQYEYFLGTKDPIIIENKNNNVSTKAAIIEALSKNNIQVGDLLYFGELNDEGIPVIHHATIITSVGDDTIKYAGNTNSRFDYSLAESFNGSDEKMVFIVPIG